MYRKGAGHPLWGMGIPLVILVAGITMLFRTVWLWGIICIILSILLFKLFA